MAASALTALVTDAYGGRGGIARFNRNLLDALAEDERLEVCALGLSGEPARDVPARLTWSVPAPNDKLRFSLAAAAATARRPPRIMLSGHVGVGAACYPLAQLARARLWTTTHGIEVWEPPAGRGWSAFATAAAARAALAGSALVTAVSDYTRRRLLSWCPIAPERVELLPNAIDLSHYTPGPRPPELEAELGVAGAKVLLTVGRMNRLERYKGHDRVVAALPELRRRCAAIRYVIVGTGDDQPRIERLARELGVAELVRFAGHVPDERLRDYYRLADVFVMPSTGEGFGIVFLEAMACGCPVVGGDRDGSVDALGGGELGRLIDPLDARALVEAVAGTLAAGRSPSERIRGVERFGVDRFRARVRELVTLLV